MASRMDLKMTRGAFSAERQGSRGHFVEHRAEREQIAARVEFFRAGLLGRHIGDGAERRAGAGEVLFVDGGRHRV